MQPSPKKSPHREICGVFFLKQEFPGGIDRKNFFLKYRCVIINLIMDKKDRRNRGEIRDA